MIPYKSKSGLISGVTAYEIGDQFIIVDFRDNYRYVYTYSSAGELAIEEMKKCALASVGLSTYIAQNNPDYESKYKIIYF